MRGVCLKAFIFFFFSLGFSGNSTVTVLSYIGKIEYSSSQFGPWRTLEIDDVVPEKGFLRLNSPSDSAELLRGDGVVIRLIGNTMVSIEAISQAPKPKQSLSGLFRKKRPLIEIKDEVAVAAVRGNIQGTPSTSLSAQATHQNREKSSLGLSLGIGGLYAFEYGGILLKGGYSNQMWHINLNVPLLWDTAGWRDVQWRTIDGWLALVEDFSFGKKTTFFTLLWGEDTITLGEGFLFERKFSRYHVGRFSENVLWAQINFGDVGIRGHIDRPADVDQLAVEVFIKPFWETRTFFESLTIKGFVVNERDASSQFFPSDFQTTNGNIDYVTGYGMSAFIPLVDYQPWLMALLGEVDGLNEKAGFMAGFSLRYSGLASMRGTVGMGEIGFMPWYFDTLSRYTRPTQKVLLNNTTNVSFAWSIGGTVGSEEVLSLSWNLKSRNDNFWFLDSGFSTGKKFPLFLFVGFHTRWTEKMLAFSPENTLSLARLGFVVGPISFSLSYTQALNKWERGSFSGMVELRF